MSKRKTQNTSYAPRRRMGCLPRLIILIVGLGACYWLVFAPIQPQQGQTETQSASQAQSEQSSTVSDNENGTPEPNSSQDPTPEPVVQGELTAEQQSGLAELSAQSSSPPDVLVEEGVVRFLSLNVSVPDTIAVSAAEKAIYFLKENSDFFQLGNAGQNLRPEGRMEDGLGNTYMRYSQQYKGVPVYGSDIIVGVNENDEVDFMNGGYAPNLEIDIQPTVRSIEAEQTVLQEIGGENAQIGSPTILAIYDPGIWEEVSNPKLAWFVLPVSETGVYELYIIDAHSNTILDRIPLIYELGGSPNIEIWDGYNYTMQQIIELGWYYGIDLVMDENGKIAGQNPDLDAQKSQAHGIKIYNYFWDYYERDSFDGEGGMIKVYVNTTLDPCRAIWRGDYTFNFGFTINVNSIFLCDSWGEWVDAMAHEFTHGVVQSTAGFIHAGEATALNEGFADIFAIFIDDVEPWRLTRILYAEDPDDIRRDFANPNYNNPINKIPIEYKDIYCSREDPDCKKKCPEDLDSYPDCGHVNSVILSHAVYILATGNNEFGLNIQPIGIGKLQQIYYYTLTNLLTSNSDFYLAGLNLLGACLKFSKTGEHGITSNDCKQINDVFFAVGILPLIPPPSPLPTATLPPNITPSPVISGTPTQLPILPLIQAAKAGGTSSANSFANGSTN